LKQINSNPNSYEYILSLAIVLLHTAVMLHNDCLMHPMYGIELRTITEGLENEK